MKVQVYLKLVPTFLSNKSTAVDKTKKQWKQIDISEVPSSKTYTKGIPFKHKEEFYMCVEIELKDNNESHFLITL